MTSFSLCLKCYIDKQNEFFKILLSLDPDVIPNQIAKKNIKLIRFQVFNALESN